MEDVAQRSLKARNAIEVLIAVLLASLGAYRVLKANPTDAWAGFALIGLGLLFYMMRGQIITRLAFSKDGFEAELAEVRDKAEAAQKEAEAAKAEAEQAVEKARVANEIVKQEVAGPAASFDTSPQLGLAEAANSDPWKHPNLERGPKPENDPQKNQWGGMAERNNRRLEVTYGRLDEDWTEVTMRVRSTDLTRPVENYVRFHLHDSFRQNPVVVQPKDGGAELKRYAWGAFTVGAEVANEPDTFLEFDMALDSEAPEEFRQR